SRPPRLHSRRVGLVESPPISLGRQHAGARVGGSDARHTRAAQRRNRQGCARRADRRLLGKQFRSDPGVYAFPRSPPLQVLRPPRERSPWRPSLCRGWNDLALYEGHGLTPTVIRAYRETAERGALPFRMHTPVSMPSAAFDDKRLLDLFYHYAGVAGGRGRGDDILRVEGINLGGHADSTVADIIAAGYPYDQWAGHFYQ